MWQFTLCGLIMPVILLVHFTGTKRKLLKSPVWEFEWNLCILIFFSLSIENRFCYWHSSSKVSKLKNLFKCLVTLCWKITIGKLIHFQFLFTKPETKIVHSFLVSQNEFNVEKQKDSFFWTLVDTNAEGNTPLHDAAINGKSQN